MATLQDWLNTNTIPTDWKSAALGGTIIGSAAILYLTLFGRVCGISGILGQVIDHSINLGQNQNQQASITQFGFIFGLLLCGQLSSSSSTTTTSNLSIPCMIFGGFLVGFGTRYGCGCTSGHGVCGLARRSMRSIVAVLCFLSTAIITATVIDIHFEHILIRSDIKETMTDNNKFGAFIGWLIYTSITQCILRRASGNILNIFASIITGCIFGFGLILSGMTDSRKVRNFLNMNFTEFSNHWDPSLMFVLCCALIISVTGYPLILHYSKKPVLDTEYHLPTNTVIDKRLIIGASIFGVGWGMIGICPGPGIVVMAQIKSIYDPFWMWCIGLFIGMTVFHPISQYQQSRNLKQKQC